MSGFIGESGSGKSTLINTIRGIYSNEEGAAKSSVLECTSNPTPYHFPNNDKISLYKFWFTFGVGYSVFNNYNSFIFILTFSFLYNNTEYKFLIFKFIHKR